eukprot:scaffold215086_cov25-Prasinocladus_malaysianus.AAC.7
MPKPVRRVSARVSASTKINNRTRGQPTPRQQPTDSNSSRYLVISCVTGYNCQIATWAVLLERISALFGLRCSQAPTGLEAQGGRL